MVERTNSSVRSLGLTFVLVLLLVFSLPAMAYVSGTAAASEPERTPLEQSESIDSMTAQSNETGMSAEADSIDDDRIVSAEQDGAVTATPENLSTEDIDGPPISGTVVDQDDVPLDGISLEIREFGGDVVWSQIESVTGE